MATKKDFVGDALIVTFNPGETGPKYVQIVVIDDDDDEPDERFTVSLSSISDVVLGKPSSVNILDNDGNSYLYNITL